MVKTRTSRNLQDVAEPEPSTSMELMDDEPALLDEENTKLAIVTLKYILNAAGARQPIKRNEIVKHCLGGINNMFYLIIGQLKKWLEDVSTIKLIFM